MVSTLAMILLNSTTDIPSYSSEDYEYVRYFRMKFFTFCVLALIGLAGPALIFTFTEAKTDTDMYPSIALFLQNFLIFFSTLILLFTGKVQTM
jgi:hypothetical protein